MRFVSAVAPKRKTHADQVPQNLGDSSRILHLGRGVVHYPEENLAS